MTRDLTWIGWVATAMSVFSYFCRNQVTLRRIQAVAAVVWMTYGAAIGARPIIAANVVVASVAGWSVFRFGRPAKAPTDPEGPAGV
jgi:hypothetical protein